jgi:hypothetical protein
VKNFLRNLWGQIISKETWRKVYWFSRRKSSGEVSPRMPITKSEILPITLSVMVGLVLIILFYWVIRMISNIAQ